MPRNKVYRTEEEERQLRADRKYRKTSWRTGATDVEKNAALRASLGPNKYAWMNQPKKPEPGSMGDLQERLIRARAKREAEKRANDREPPSDLVQALEEGLERASAQASEDFEKEFEARQENDSNTPASIHPQVSSVGQSNSIRPHLPTPEAHSPDRSSPMAIPPPVTPAGPITPASIGQTSPLHSQSTKKTSAKRKRGTQEEPIEISSGESSPIVISSREGTPTPTSQAPAAKKAKTVPSLEEELEAAFAEISAEQENVEKTLSFEEEMKAAFADIKTKDENARMLRCLQEEVAAITKERVYEEEEYEEEDSEEEGPGAGLSLEEEPEAASTEGRGAESEPIEGKAGSGFGEEGKALVAEGEDSEEETDEEEKAELYQVIDYARAFMNI
ncbi:hypothetical protein F5B19DRAFT_489721 [Rostrohypoxylon terebratum]|nr:hypothetical protein F5B19DRAFT_489721 [Rostrohypoxylon terebratum]